MDKEEQEDDKIIGEWLTSGTKELTEKAVGIFQKRIARDKEKFQKASALEKAKILWHDQNRVEGTPTEFEDLEKTIFRFFELGYELGKEDYEKRLLALLPTLKGRVSSEVI